MGKNQDTLSMELMHELLKDLNAKFTKFDDRFRLNNERLSAIEHPMAGFYTSSIRLNDEVDGLKERMRVVEKRLDLRDE